jgi:thiol-disulfide isomerase/thioredoxin
MKKLIFIFFLLIAAVNSPAQSGRAKQPSPEDTPVSTAELPSVEKLFNETSEYAARKFAELEKSRTPYNQAVYEQVLREQRQLAARYVTEVAARKELSAEDSYFLGLLQNLSTNFDDAIVSFRKFLASEKPEAEKSQRARFLLVAANVVKNNLPEAENYLMEYLKNTPIKTKDKSELENMLARGYFEKKDFERAASHAEEAYRAIKVYFEEPTTRPAEIYKVYQMATLLFSIQKENGNTKQAISTLEDLQKLAASHEASDIYFSATDKIITLMIDTGHKTEAMALFEKTGDSVDKIFHTDGVLADVKRMLRKRERQYEIMQEKAPEFTLIDSWLSGSNLKLSGLQGKVVLLDFWATWCGPCIGAFPTLSRWQQDYRAQGLEIIGITRYYGTAYGLPADEAGELGYLRNFVKTQRLPYEIAMAKNNDNHIFYGATSLPTAVLIDRKGIIRYITAGTNSTRDDETEKMIEKLLAEK